LDWHKLPPKRMESCEYRSSADTDDDTIAGCDIMVQVGVPKELCQVGRDVCSACVNQFPPTHNCWNTVIASLVYSRSHRALESSSLEPQRRAALAQIQDHALKHLPEVEMLVPDVKEEQGCEPRSLRDILPPARPRGRHRVKSWAVGIVSSPRRRPTLDVVVDSIIRAGWDHPYLFLDGAVRVKERLAHLPGVLREPRIGCWPNYYMALAELLMRHPDVDAYLLAEDDALFCDSGEVRGYLEQMLWPAPRPCIVSLYCPSAYSARKFGWQPRLSAWTWGALAFIFPRRVAREFLLDSLVCNHRWGKWQEEHQGLANTDIVIGEWATQREIPIWYPTPSLVQHIGTTSTLDLNLQVNSERRASRWAGDFTSLC
jgi:hypothetical protein